MTSHLSSVAMLVDFSVSQWTARKIDKPKSDAVNDEARANRKASYVSKKLVLADTLTMIGQCKNRAYDRHRELTLPWLDNGPRILPATMHATYSADMEKFEAEFYPLVATFVRNYPTYIERAATSLGALFNANDYPKASRIESKFAWRISYLPMPDAADFRVDIGKAAIARVKANVEATVNASVANAVRDVFERVHDKVAALVEKLPAYKPAAQPGDKVEGIFRDSLIENVRDLVAILPGLNFTNDPRVTMLAKQMAGLVEHDAEALRASDNLRADVAAKAAAVVQAVSDFMA